MSNPKTSSGRNWTREEDDKLEKLLLALCEGFPDRSVAAVLSRAEYLKLSICRKIKDA